MFLKRHWLAVACAVLVGVIYIAPQIFFIVSLGSAYKGIPMLQTPNEDSYLGRIHDIVDGHGALGSPFFFEYKGEPPLSPPTGEWFYAAPALVLGISPATVLVISKFILPAILFLLVYALIGKLTGSGALPQKMNAIAGGLLVVLGYDLIDYRTVLSYLSGDASPGAFLLWSRPVNPILGAIFLFSFLLCVFAIMRNTRWRKSAVVGAAAFLAFMFGSYFFSWGVALSVLVVLVFIFLLRKEYRAAGGLALIAPLGILLAAPYWYGAWRASQSPWYEASVLRSGLFLTHYPLLNKLLLAVLLFFVFALAFDFIRKRTKGIAFTFEPWHLFCSALFLGGLWAFSEQVITGRTVWPYHFVQYTIPFSMVVGMTALYRIVREYTRFLFVSAVSVAALASLIFGIYVQKSAYTHAHPYYAKLQEYAPLLDWLNTQEKDCVVFVNEDSSEMTHLNMLIPAFTPCNRYSSSELYSLIPEERGRDSYLATLRLKGVLANGIGEYLRANRSEAVGYLYSNWQGVFGVTDFPDFSDPLLEKRLKEFPAQYRDFMQRDFEGELKKYRLNFLLIRGEPSVEAQRLLRSRSPVHTVGDLALYQF